MCQRFTALSCKEVINVTDGCRLGYTSDLELDLECGRVIALIVPKPGRFFWPLGQPRDLCDPLGVYPPHRQRPHFGGRQSKRGLPPAGKA